MSSPEFGHVSRDDEPQHHRKINFRQAKLSETDKSPIPLPILINKCPPDFFICVSQAASLMNQRGD